MCVLQHHLFPAKNGRVENRSYTMTTALSIVISNQHAFNHTHTTSIHTIPIHIHSLPGRGSDHCCSWCPYWLPCIAECGHSSPEWLDQTMTAACQSEGTQHFTVSNSPKLTASLFVFLPLRKWLPYCIKHRCARQCFLRHSGKWSPLRRKADAPSAESCHSGRPGSRGSRGHIIRTY